MVSISPLQVADYFERGGYSTVEPLTEFLSPSQAIKTLPKKVGPSVLPAIPIQPARCQEDKEKLPGHVLTDCGSFDDYHGQKKNHSIIDFVYQVHHGPLAMLVLL